MTNVTLEKQSTWRDKIHHYVNQSDDSGLIRVFLKAVDRGNIPFHIDLVPWCMQQLGHTATQRLIKALATWSCPTCDHGLDPCQLCDGTGWSLPDVVCESCLGLGVVPCEFCGGASVSTLETIPEGLRPAVVAARIDIALNRLQTLKQDLKILSSSTKPKRHLKQYQQILLLSNELLALLESSLDEIRSISLMTSRQRALIQKLQRLCVKTGSALERLVQGILQQMIKIEILRMRQHPGDTEQRTASQSRIECLQALLRTHPHYEGTFLQHPRLEQAINKNHPGQTPPPNVAA